MENLDIDLDLTKIQSEYPTSCLPEKLHTRSGKAKLSKFEELDLQLYEPDARMVSFHTSLPRLQPWIKTLSILYYDNLGKEESPYKVEWTDIPDHWEDRNSSANSISIQLKALNDDPNPILYKMYKVNFYINTGTITVQGNHYKLFVQEHFSILKELLNLVLDKYHEASIR